MTINAVLQRLVLSSPDPEQMGRFYERAFDYQATMTASECRCEANDRSLWVRRGAANQLLQSHFVFSDAAALDRYAAGLEARGVPYRQEQLNGSRCLVVRDPDDREVWFGAAASRQTLIIRRAVQTRTLAALRRTPSQRRKAW